jgi:hypothetical protein
MYIDEMFGDGQAETSASGFPGTRDIDAVKPLEDARLVRLGNTNAGV